MAMTCTNRDSSLSVRTTLAFADAVAALRRAFTAETLRPIAELSLHREVERITGLRWRNYVIITVWSPGHSCQALLAEPDAGLLMPFNFVVADDGTHTVITATNHGLYASTNGSVAVEMLTRTLVRKVRNVLAYVVMDDVTQPSAAREKARAAW